MHEARLSDDEPASTREQEAYQHVFGHPECRPGLNAFVPGYVQLCRGRTGDGAVLAGLGALELGGFAAGAATNGITSNEAGIPLLALGDLLTISVTDLALENQRALKLRFVPQENLAELALAPFSGQVLRRPEVWGGIAGALAAGLLVSRLVDGPIGTDNLGKRPVLFGHTVNSAVGYPAAAAMGAAVFEHVALAEESIFRGFFQSTWSRKYGEHEGLVFGSLAFGLLHASNIVFIDPSQRASYLAAGVPFITAFGFYLGAVYRSDHYSLAPTVAIHFWYDFLLEAISFIGDPKNSPLAVTWGMPF
jgi:membrane protease YdiL (CAAX protease family)